MGLTFKPDDEVAERLIFAHNYLYFQKSLDIVPAHIHILHITEQLCEK